MTMFPLNQGAEWYRTPGQRIPGRHSDRRQADEIVEHTFSRHCHELMDLRGRRAAARERFEFGERVGAAAGQRLDTAIETIAHPAGKAEPTGLAFEPGAVTDALYQAGDPELAANRRHVRVFESRRGARHCTRAHGAPNALCKARTDMSPPSPPSATRRELAPAFQDISLRVIAMMESRDTRDSDFTRDELRLLARFVELARILGLCASAAYHWAQIQLGDAQHTASLAALGQHDPRRTAINTHGWWNAWQDQWQADGLPPLT